MTKIKFNVAQLLREAVGAQREYEFSEAALPLDDTQVLRDIAGTAHFTRTTTGVFAHVTVQGVITLECVRSLEAFDYQVVLDIVDELHSVIDVMTGAVLAKPPEEDPFLLDELHMADIGELIREYTLLELPLNPVCAAYQDYPVSYSVQSESGTEDENDGIDERLQVLKQWSARQNDDNSG